MPIRLKVLRRQEERINKVKELMDMFKVPSMPTYDYQPMGASSFSNWTTTTAINDPRIQKTKDLFQMFHLEH